MKEWNKLSHYLHPKGGLCVAITIIVTLYNSNRMVVIVALAKMAKINSLLVYKSAPILGSKTQAAEKVCKMEPAKTGEDPHWWRHERGNRFCSIHQTRRRQEKRLLQWCNQGQRVGQQPFDRRPLWRRATV